MFKKLFSLASVGAMAIAGFAAVPSAAEAQGYGNGGGYYGRNYDRGYRDRGSYRGDRGYYRDRGSYRGDRGYYRGNRGYADRRYYGGRGRCRDNGTGGTILGAIAGGLLGNEVGNGRYGRGDGTTGAIVGAGVGALAGRAIDRNC